MAETTRMTLVPPQSLAMLAGLALLFALVPLAGTARAHGSVVTKGPGDGFVTSSRFAGQDRFATSALIATNTPGFADSQTVFIARADLFPDSLAGSYLAGQLRAPVLLLDRDVLVHDTVEALEALDPDKVIILGGNKAISEQNEQRLRDEGYETERIGGVGRYETAALIANEGFSVGRHDERRTAIVANGDVFADALVTGALAYNNRFPLLLTRADRLPGVTRGALERLFIEQVIIPGGLRAVSQGVRDELAGMGLEVISLAGRTRVDTAAEVARFAVEELGFGSGHVNFARGDHFPDALSLAPHGGEEQSVVLLTVDPGRVDSNEHSVEQFLTTRACGLERLHLAGGTAAISDGVEAALRGFATCLPASLTLAPQTATAVVGQAQTLTATVVTEADAPAVGLDVAFTTQTGTGTTANPIPQTATAKTDAQGRAEFVLTSSGPGEVTVTASVAKAGGGQLSAQSTLTFTADVTARMSGLQEFPPVLTTARGTFAAGVVGSDRLCFGVQVTGLSSAVTVLDIHEGTLLRNGPVVVDLGVDAVLDQLQELGAAGACVGIDAGTAEALKEQPGNYYVQVHTTQDNPNGEIRGQLS